MKIVTRYLACEVYSSILVAIFVLLAIFLSNQFIRYMHSASVGIFSSSAIKVLLLLQLPILSAILLPASLYVGILLAYGRLYADNEMTIFAVCGMNPKRLLKTTLGFSAIIMILVGLLSLWFNPKVYKYSDHIASGAATNSLDMVKPNYFNSVADGKWVFYVDSMSQDKKRFYNVFAAEQFSDVGTNSSDATSVVTAKQAYQKTDQNTGAVYMVLLDGYRYTGIPGGSEYEVVKYDEYTFQVQKNMQSWHSDHSSVPTVDLWRDRHNKLSMAELQWRLSLPLSAFVLTLLGTPLSRIKPKGGRYAKMGLGILLYIIYANLLFLARAWIRSGFLPAFLGMWWVHGLVLILAIALIGKQIGWKHIFAAD